MKRNQIYCSVVAPLAALTCAVCDAVPLAINNSGFETDVLADGVVGDPTTSWENGYYGGEMWTILLDELGIAGAINPNSGYGYGGNAYQGDNVGWAASFAGDDQGLSQVLSSVLQADKDYQLSVQMGNPGGAGGNGGGATGKFRIELVANNVVLASSADTLVPAGDVWALATLSFESGSAHPQLGQPLEIRLIAADIGADGLKVNFDEVTLTEDKSNSPSADAGGPYDVAPATSLVLEGSASTPADGSIITAWDWDLNNDGIFGDATGAMPTAIPLADLSATWGMALGRSNTIRLRVTDLNTKTSTVSTVVRFGPGVPITVVNGGFEDPGLPDGDYIDDPSSYGWFGGYYTGAGTAWTLEVGYTGILNPSITRTSSGIAPEGNNTGYISAYVGYGVGMTQVLTGPLGTAQPDAVYNLYAIVGNPFGLNAGATADYQIEWLVGGVRQAFVTGPAPLDDTTYVYPNLTWTAPAAGDPLIGQSLEIRLFALDFTTAFEVDFDDINLYVQLTGPVAGPGGPYAVAPATSVTLDASASVSSHPGGITNFEWDLNGNGAFGDPEDLSSATPTLSAIAQTVLLTTHGMSLGLNIVNLRVTDVNGNSPVVSTTVQTGPIADPGGPYPSVPAGGFLLLNGNASLPSHVSGITLFEWDLNGNGVFGEAQDHSSAAALAGFSYANLLATHGMGFGNNTVNLRVTDGAGVSPVTTATMILLLPEGVSAPILNAGFEFPPRGEGGFGAADDWEVFGSAEAGNWNPEVGDFPAQAPKEDNVGYVYGATVEEGFSQVLSGPYGTLHANASYLLAVEVGNSMTYAGFPGYRFQLLAGGVVLAEDDNTLAPGEGLFVLSTVLYSYDPAHSALLGEPLEIRLLSKNLVPDVEMEFDDVRLTTTFVDPVAAHVTYSVPEAGSLSLDGSGSAPSVGGTMVTSWEWDLDNNGSTDVTGEFPAALTIANLTSIHGMRLGANPIRLKVTDNAVPPRTHTVTGTVTIPLSGPPNPDPMTWASVPTPGGGAVLVYESFDYTTGTTLTGNGGTGFDGPWATTGTNLFTVDILGLTFTDGWDVLEVAGNSAYRTAAGNRSEANRVISAASQAALMTDGSTMWFSVLYEKIAAAGNAAFLIGTDTYNVGAGGTLNNFAPAGEGFGFGSEGDMLVRALAYDGSATPIADISTVDTLSARLIVGKIVWNSNGTADELYLYDIIDLITEPTMPIATVTADLDQSAFDLVVLQHNRNNATFDEIRLGNTYASVAGHPDSPGTRIRMTATTATDPSGVDYYFEETSGNPGGDDSGWQDSPTYIDTGLTPGLDYTYRVRTRDRSPAQNTSAWSGSASATTDTGTVVNPVITSVDVIGADLVVGFTGVDGTPYKLTESAGLATPFAGTGETATTVGGVGTFTYLGGAAAGKNFVRVEED